MAVFFAGPLIIIVLLIVLLSAALFVVPQQQAYIIERFGKFLKVQFAGIHIRIPFVDRIAMKTNMRVNQLNVQLETKTLDNVFVTVVASTQFRVNPNDVATAYYELRDPAGQLRSYMEDALRSAIPALSLDDAFARKDDVAFDVQKTVGAEMSRFGFTVVKTLITAIDPSPQVKNAMDSINAAQREKEATRQRAEAQRIQIETQAAADAEKRFYDLKAAIKAAEARMGEIQTLRTHIMNYSRTRSVYTGYRKAGYSKKYLAEHEGDILIHKAAKKAFDAFGLKKLPTVRSLNEEFARLLAEKKAAYAEYHRAQEQMRELLIHKANAACLLGLDEQNRQTTERQREEK